MKKVLAVSSGGGHWIELLRLRPAIESQGLTTVYVTVATDYRADVAGHRFYSITDVTRWDRLKYIPLLFKLAIILMIERPDILVSTGAAPGYVAARLARVIGAKIIWVDSLANVDELSMSGQLIGKHADLWLTQWPHLTTEDGPEYFGSVL